MGLFRKQRIMKNFEPMQGVNSIDDVYRRLSEAHFEKLPERNEASNSALAWVETNAPHEFDPLKMKIIVLEAGIHAEKLVELYPHRTHQEAIGAQLQGLMALARARNERQMLERLPGTNLPEIVEANFKNLLEALKRT